MKELILNLPLKTVILYNININTKMVQYNSVTVKLLDLQVDKLKPATKNKTGVILSPSSDKIADSKTSAKTDKQLSA